MKRVVCTWLFLSLAPVAATAGGATAHAPTQRAAVTPAAAALQAKIDAALGGREKLDKVRSLYVKVEAEVRAMSLRMTIHTTATGRCVMVKTEMAGAMQALQGFDGETAWSKDMIFGLRKLEGGERFALVSSTLDAGRWPERIYDRICTRPERIQFDGRQVVQLVLSKTDMPDTILYVDAETFRPLGMKQRQVSIQGEVDSTIHFHHYARSASGVRYADQLTIEAGPMVMNGLITVYHENVPCPDALFAMPAPPPAPAASAATGGKK